MLQEEQIPDSGRQATVGPNHRTKHFTSQQLVQKSATEGPITTFEKVRHDEIRHRAAENVVCFVTYF